MKIYYFNITYTCNSSCVFCYSHNTIHTGDIHKEIDLDDFEEYLNRNNVSSSDRVIINGGEPFLHSRIIEILTILKSFECETLIYTNGRCLSKFNLDFLNDRFRFVIPVHGYRELHDTITRRGGSYDEMLNGLVHLSKCRCLVDVKVIINYRMISSDDEFSKSLASFNNLTFNNAVHITQMADTVVSIKNKCITLTTEMIRGFVGRLFEYFKKTGCKIKIFDTCIYDIDVDGYIDNNIPIEVFFKDYGNEWQYYLKHSNYQCKYQCKKSHYCVSAVDEFLVLEYDNGFKKGLE